MASSTRCLRPGSVVTLDFHTLHSIRLLTLNCGLEPRMHRLLSQLALPRPNLSLPALLFHSLSLPMLPSCRLRPPTPLLCSLRPPTLPSHRFRPPTLPSLKLSLQWLPSLRLETAEVWLPTWDLPSTCGARTTVLLATALLHTACVITLSLPTWSSHSQW